MDPTAALVRQSRAACIRRVNGVHMVCHQQQTSSCLACISFRNLHNRGSLNHAAYRSAEDVHNGTVGCPANFAGAIKVLLVSHANHVSKVCW